MGDKCWSDKTLRILAVVCITRNGREILFIAESQQWNWTAVLLFKQYMCS